MYVCNSEIVQKANRIVAQCGTRDPKRIARELGIEVMYLPFSKQRGAYKVIMRNRFMFIKDNLHPVMALKADTLISQGYRLRPQEHCNDFLKYNR